MKPPRVLFVIPGDGEGCSMVFARRQAETLVQRGLAEVEVFHLRSRTAPHVLWRESRRFRAHLRTFRPDIVHAHFGTMTAAFAAALSTDVPLMITFRGSDLNKVPMASGLRPALGHLLSQLAALRAAWMVCVSRGLREQLWWKRKCATVLPSGVDTDAFQPMPQAEARAALGWPEEGRVVLFNAGHDPVNKRLDLALAAVQEAARTIADLRIEVVSGQVAPELMPLYMNAADCLLVTSDAEGSPTVVQEALVTELPVVSVNVGDIQDRLRGISPSAIATRDPHMLAEALCTVLAAGRRSNGRSRVREICSTHIADELAHLYRQVIATRHPGRIPTWSTTHS